MKKGRKKSQEEIEKIRKSKLGDKNPMFGRKGDNHPLFGTTHSKETKEKMKKNHKGMTGKKQSEEFVSRMSGENSPVWIKDRTLLKKKQERNDSAYQEWRKGVYSRDLWKCKFKNEDCKGKIEAHHILSWTDYPELRYNIENGITLCHHHHPRKWKQEEELIPTFKELITINN